jgi:uncharacterized protein (DUF885 family)
MARNARKKNAAKPKHQQGSVDAFHALAEAHVERSFERFPTHATAVGRHEFDGELQVPTPKLYRTHQKDLAATLEAVQSLPEHDFSGDDWLDRRALIAELRTELWSIERDAHRQNPEAQASAAISAIHDLVVRHADDLLPVAEAVVSRLGKLPRFLDGAMELVERPVPVWTKMAVSSAEGAPGFLDALVEPLVATRKVTRKKMEKLVSEAKLAFRSFARHVDRSKQGKPGGFCVGEQRFEALIRERLGWDLSAREAEALGRALVDRLEAELAAEAKKHGGKKARDLLDKAAANWRLAHGDLLGEYQHTTQHVKEAFRKADVVSYPAGDVLAVKPVPDFLRHQFPTAAYSAPGAYDRDQTGIFWVNDLSLIRESEADKLAEIRQHFGLPLTAAHEAYPGHHLQFCTANRHPSKLRRLFAHAVFYEGWTLWVEQMSIDFGIVEDQFARLTMLHDALWRAHRILIDCGLHSGRMSYDDATRHLMKHVGFTRARAEGDVNWYTAMPTVPMSYLIGKMELLRLKRRKVDEGGMTLKAFNDWALSFGTIPWRWMEQSGL